MYSRYMKKYGVKGRMEEGQGKGFLSTAMSSTHYTVAKRKLPNLL